MATNMDVFDTKKVYTEFDFIVGQMNVWRGCEGRYDISTQDTLDEIKERFGYLTKEQMKMVFEEVESGFIWDIEKDDIKHEDYEESDEEEEEVRTCCEKCEGEGSVRVSKERAKELKEQELLEGLCPFGDKCAAEEEEEDEEDPAKNPYTHPYYCDGGCGKVMGRDQWELDCQRICDFCEEPYEESDEEEEKSNIVFHCSGCGVGIIRDSRDHDNCVTKDGKKWYCPDCYHLWEGYEDDNPSWHSQCPISGP